MNQLLKKLLLIIIGLFVAVLLAELVLRITRPDLEHLAHTHFEENRYRIHSNPTNTTYARRHPDSAQYHKVIHNSLGLRQHREFSREKPAGTVRIGFFGDSYTENLRMPSQYSFTEPIEYLLNKTGGKYEILNFGTDGYGTSQIYLQYMDDAVDLDLDAVVYVQCENDILDSVATELVALDEDGNLKYLPVKKRSLWVSVARKFYLTYFLMGRFGESALQKDYDLDALPTKTTAVRIRHQLHHVNHFPKSLKLYRALITALIKETSQRGQTLAVILIPKDPSHNNRVRPILEAMGVPVLDMYPLFGKGDERQRRFFRNDMHWNEEGNKICAVLFFKYLADLLKIPYGGDDFIQEGLFEYYSAFDRAPISDAWLKPVDTPETLRESIRKRYLALEL